MDGGKSMKKLIFPLFLISCQLYYLENAQLSREDILGAITLLQQNKAAVDEFWLSTFDRSL